MFVDFMGVCFDQIYNQAAKFRYMFGGKAVTPVVIRTMYGAGLRAAAQHSQCLYPLFTQIPGLKVVLPATPYDAKGLMIQAIRDNDPVMFFEHKALYDLAGPVPEESYALPFGEANVVREGGDVTIVTLGRMVHTSLEAAGQLAADGVQCEVIDLRTTSPLDEDTVLESVEGTGRLVVVDEAHPRCSIATDISALVARKAFGALQAPIEMVTAPHTPVPFSNALEDLYIPERPAHRERGQDGDRVDQVTDQRIVPVTMPKWGLSMQLGKITSWIAAEGDEIAVGDELADIETEKIAGTLEAAEAGTLRRVIARVGEDVPVGGTIALIAPAEVSEEDLDAAARQARAVIDAGVPPDVIAPAVQTAKAGGRKISYAGIGADGDVVLLIHGYGGDRNSWLFLQEPLAARCRVYALDLPGHGTSAKDVGDGSVGVLADAVVAVLDALDIARAHLVGHSLGGAVALAVTARDLRRIASLTLIAPAGFGSEINAGYLRGFAGAQTRRELKPVLGQLFADEDLVTRQVVDDLLAYKRLDGVDEALHTLLGALLVGDAQRADSAASVAAIGGAVPMTVVWGRADRIIPATQAESVDGAVRRLIDDAGHMPHMERPAEVQAAIEETIARAGQPAPRT